MTFALPSFGKLRLVLDHAGKPPSLWLSSDGQLWQQSRWEPSTTPREWFYIHRYDDPLFAQLKVIAPFEGKVFVAEEESVDPPLPYQQDSELNLETTTALDESGALQRVYWLPANKTTKLKVMGPSVLALRTRPALPAPDGGAQADYAFSWGLDRGGWQVVTIPRAQTSSELIKVNGCSLLGPFDEHYLVISGGIHKLRLRAALPLLIRVTQADVDPYQLELNEPQPTVRARLRRLSERSLNAGSTKMPLPVVDALRRSNHLHEAASAALDWLNRQSSASPSQLQGEMSDTIEQDQGFFRDLAPVPSLRPVQPRMAWFTRKQPLRDQESPAVYVDAKGSLNQFSQGLFIDVSDQAMSYIVPQRDAPSTLRVVTALPSKVANTSLWIQYDNQPPRRLQLSKWRLGDNLSASAPALLAHYAKLTHPTLSGAFAQQHTAGPFWQTASIELHLPLHIERVRIWSDASLKVALQYRTSKPYDLGESGYALLLRLQDDKNFVGQFHRALSQVVNKDAKPLPVAIPPSRALANQWYPLLRYLHAAQAIYLDDLNHENFPKPVREAADLRITRAKAAAQQKNWLEVIAALKTLGYSGNLPAYHLTQLALTRLKEYTLALHHRQSMAVFRTNTPSHQAAVKQLIKSYRQTQDWDSQIGLFAALFLRTGAAAWLARLGEVLLQSGESEWAMHIGLLLAHDGKMPNWLPKAAQKYGSYQSIKPKIKNRPSPRKLKRLQTERAIAVALQSTDQARRNDAISRWLAWSLHRHGRFSWVPVSDQVVSAKGVITLVSELTRKPFTALQASPNFPVKLQVIGPVVLRVRARSFYTGAQNSGTDWVRAEIDGATYYRPLFKQPINPYVTLLGDNRRVTIADEFLVLVPPGLHTIRLRPQRQTQLLQIWQWRRNEQSSILPPLTPLTLQDIVTSKRTSVIKHQEAEPDYWQVQACKVRPRSLLPAGAIYTHGLEKQAADIPGSIVFPSQPVEPHWPAGNYAVPAKLEPQPLSSARLPETAKAAYAQAVAWFARGAPEPGRRIDTAIQIARLAHAFPAVSALQQLNDEVMQAFSWQHLTSSFDSAGVRPHPITEQSLPEFRRIRLALSPEIPAPSGSSLWLYGHDIAGVEFSNPKPLPVDLQLRQLSPPFEKINSATVMVQIDDKQPTRVVLAKEHTLQLQIPRGDHAVRVWLRNPTLQTLVLVRIIPAAHRVLLEPEEQLYHVASRHRPAKFYIKGPAWIRINEWRANVVSQRFEYIRRGWHPLVLRAGPQGQDRYYRVYILEPEPETKPLASALTPVDVRKPAQAPLAPAAASTIWKAVDVYPLGANNDDSWAGYIEAGDRNSSTEEDPSISEGTTYLEAGARYRRYWPESLLYSRTDVLLRQLDAGGRVAGTRQWLDWYPQQSPWEFGFFGEAYAQPGDITDVTDDIPWSLHVQGELARDFQLNPQLEHELSFALNRRFLSLDQVSTGALAEIDPEIYTPYKDDHQQSLTLSDRLMWWPALDQRIYLEGAITSNEDLNLFLPDHFGLTTAAGQLFGPVSAEAGVRWRYYLDDEDREQAYARSRLFLRLNWLRWNNDSNALYLRTEANYDIDRGLSWQLTLSWEDNEGGLSPSLRPDEIDFLDLRRSLQQHRVRTSRLVPVYK